MNASASQQFATFSVLQLNVKYLHKLKPFVAFTKSTQFVKNENTSE